MKASRLASRAVLLACGALAAVPLLALREAGTALIRSRPLQDPDTIVMLASREWERLPAVVALAHQYPQARVLLTVPPPGEDAHCHDCPNRPRTLMRRGVGDERIRSVSLTDSSTYGEAMATRRFARATPIRRLLIVTSPYHTRRALATFRNVLAGTGIEIGIEPASASSPARPTAWLLSPYDRWYVRYEWAAILYYRLKYGIGLVSARSPP